MSYFYDTTELRKMIIDNPELPLLVFASEDANSGENSWEYANIRWNIDELALYNDELWVDYDEYMERLSCDLSDEEEYKGMSDEEYNNMIEEMIDNIEFTDCIVIWVG